MTRKEVLAVRARAKWRKLDVKVEHQIVEYIQCLKKGLLQMSAIAKACSSIG